MINTHTSACPGRGERFRARVKPQITESFTTSATLKTEIIKLFLGTSLRLDDPPADYPTMNDQTLRDLVLRATKPRSAKFLQKALHGIYEQRRTQHDRYSRKYEVEYSEIIDYVYRYMC